MTSAIESPPNDNYDFGLSFNYATWIPGTRVNLLNVSWNNDYRDVVRFADRAALKTYLDGITTSGITIENVSYLKFGEPVMLDIPFNVAIQYNYLRASNPTQPIDGNDIQRDYFYFITNVEYVAPNTTRLTLQLDIFQTYIYDVTFGNCYIERGHIGIANEKGFDHFGRDYLTVPEGLDIGGEYQVIAKASQWIMLLQGNGSSSVDDSTTLANVLVASTVDLNSPRGTTAAPLLTTAKGSSLQGLVSGAAYYIFENFVSFSNFMVDIASTPWISQGIISITMIPPITRYNLVSFGDAGTGPLFGAVYGISSLFPRKYPMMNNWRDQDSVINNIPTRYRGLKKLFTFPYMAIELTTWTGTPVILKPESWADTDATVTERINIVPPNQRVAIHPYKYNAIDGAPDDAFYPGADVTHNVGGDDNGEWLDIATIISNFPSLALVNNGSLGFLASNANGIAFQYSDASWSQQRALGSNQTQYDQASASMNLANELTGIGIGADTAQTAQNNFTASQQTQNAQLGGAGGAIIGAIGSAPNPLGMAGSIGNGALGAALAQANLGVQQNQNTQSLAIRNAAAGASNRSNVGTQGFMRDTNKNLADWSANGDYANKIAGINAKVQDAKLIQPSTSGQVGGDAMNAVNNNLSVSFRVKMIDQAAIRTVGEYWLRYGYAVRKFSTIPDDLMVMEKFTYWKLLETYISQAPMPEAFKQIIRGIFEKGVTVWRNPADIGNVDIGDNAPLEGISL